VPAATGAIEEARAELIGALYNWDFSPAYPTGYAGTKAPVLVNASPEDIIQNFITYTKDQQTKAIISVELVDIMDTHRALGDHLGPGAGNLQRYGTRVDLTFNVECWADQQSGGSDLVQKLASQVEGCAFYNKVRLTAYRHLITRSGREAYEDRVQLWRCGVLVYGDGVASYDA
jgi:hypothetical protein